MRPAPRCCALQVLGSLEDDYVWIHDYHLLVLPSLLRKRFHRIKCAWGGAAGGAERGGGGGQC